MKLELWKGDSVEGSDDTPMFNPHTLPLISMTALLAISVKTYK